jgi:starch synthase
MKILFVSSEGVPYSKTGGLADVVGALPKALVALGHEVAVLLPRYHGNPADKVVLQSLTVSLGRGARFPAIVNAGKDEGVQSFLVDDPEYFDRPQLYGDKAGDYPDNAERFATFSRAAIEFAKHVWMPDIFHCHDWQAALVPVLLRSVYLADAAVNQIPVVFTIHNLSYQGHFGAEVMERLGLPESLYSLAGLEFYGRVNFLKGGLLAADYLTTVSRKYAEEIQTPRYGCGLEGVIRHRADHLAGILNGVDYSVWDPKVDAKIAARFSARSLAGKQACKKDLLQTMGLPAENLRRPVIGIVSRFTDQKGFDLLAETADQMLKEDLAIVALGTGDPKYEDLFRTLAAHASDRVAVRIAYDDTLAHKIEAGADMFLMPSSFEPCGLNQIYSLRYGTVPVVRATGGLEDTIEAYDPKTGKGTGFKFQEYKGMALLECLRQALAVFGDKKAWKSMQTRGMGKDFSWKASAAAYAQLYERAQESRIAPSAAASNNQGKRSKPA